MPPVQPPEAPGKLPEKREQPKKSLESEIRESIRLIESDVDSVIEWRALKLFYRDLLRIKKPNKRVQALIDMIKPVLNKYGHS